MSEDLRVKLEALSEDDLVTQIMWHRTDYTESAWSVLVDIAQKRGYTPEVISELRRTRYVGDWPSQVCKYCKMELMLDSEEFAGGEFRCPNCEGLCIVDYGKVVRIEPGSVKDRAGYRYVPVVTGLVSCCLAFAVFWLFGSNIITWLVGGVFIWFGWSSMKVGFFGSQRLLNEMCLDRSRNLSNESGEEWERIQESRGLSVRKTEVDANELCRSFYNSHLFAVGSQGVDYNEVYIKSVRDVAAKLDPGMTEVDLSSLVREATMIRLEMFGLAWLHLFGYESAIAQSVLTKEYLHESLRGDLWTDSLVYNQEIARSSYLGHTSETKKGRDYVSKLNLERSMLFDENCKKGVDSECVARALNRHGTVLAWQQGMTAECLMSALCDRLNLRVNRKAQEFLKTVICGYYEGAYHSMENVRISVQ